MRLEGNRSIRSGREHCRRRFQRWNYSLASGRMIGLLPMRRFAWARPYQAGGLFDKAIDAYQRNQFRYPKSLAASKSAVPLAQAYIAKGAKFYAKAERMLLGVVEDNPLVDPSAEEFSQSLKELAQLYYPHGAVRAGDRTA